MKTKKETRGGKRKGAGRKPGKKAFVNSKPNPTKLRRIPLPIIEHVDEIISNYYNSIK